MYFMELKRNMEEDGLENGSGQKKCCSYRVMKAVLGIPVSFLHHMIVPFLKDKLLKYNLSFR